MEYWEREIIVKGRSVKTQNDVSVAYIPVKTFDRNYIWSINREYHTAGITQLSADRS